MQEVVFCLKNLKIAKVTLVKKEDSTNQGN